MDNVSIKMETLEQNQKDMAEMKNTVTGMKNTFDRLISRLGTTDESVLKGISIETSQTEKQT
jgi:hypothetical protein